MNYEKYIVAFIDILAFKNLVFESMKDEFIFKKLKDALNQFSDLTKREAWEEAKNLMNIEECAQTKNLEDFYIDGIVHTICFSDSVVITIKADKKINERLSALIAQLSKIGSNLLRQNILIRGGIAYGDLYIEKDKNLCFGDALITAYELENKNAVYPRFLLSKSLIDKMIYPYSKQTRMPYHQYVECFEDGLIGFSPLIFYQVMQSAPEIISKENLESDLLIIRENIINNLDDAVENPHYFVKHDWLKKYYNQLAILDCEFKKIEIIKHPMVTKDIFFKDKCN